MPSPTPNMPTVQGSDPTAAFYPSTTRTQQLRTLSTQVNQQLSGEAGAQQDQRVAGLQNSIHQAASQGARATAGQVQAMGAQQAQQQGQIALGAAQTAITRQGQIGAMGLEEQYAQNQAELLKKKQQLSATNQQLQNQLAQLNVKVKQELIDKQTKFAQDEMGRTIFNDRQLMDYQLQKAQTQQDLQSYEQAVQQTSQKRLALLKQSYSVLQDAMKQANEGYNAAMDQQQKIQIQKAIQAVQLKIRQEQAAQRNRAGMFSAAGQIVGAGAGAVIGTLVEPGGGTVVGATLGAQLGGGLGNVAAGSST